MRIAVSREWIAQRARGLLPPARVAFWSPCWPVDRYELALAIIIYIFLKKDIPPTAWCIAVWWRTHAVASMALRHEHWCWPFTHPWPRARQQLPSPRLPTTAHTAGSWSARLGSSRGRYNLVFWVRAAVDSGPLAHVYSRNFKDTCIHNMNKYMYLRFCCFSIQGTHAQLVLKMVWIPHVTFCVWSTDTMYRFTQLCFAN
jgi:hypothetical protein